MKQGERMEKDMGVSSFLTIQGWGITTEGTDESSSCYDAVFYSAMEQGYAENYMDSHDVLEEFRQSCPITSSVAILKNLNVDEEERGNGRGTELLENFLEEAEDKGIEHIFLIADTGEANDFCLVSWYERYGFRKVTSSEAFPLMHREMALEKKTW